jgi:hypothetical protein
VPTRDATGVGTAHGPKHASQATERTTERTPMNDLNDLDFVKASGSAPNNACVEVAKFKNGDVAVRDSKDKGRGPVLQFTAKE